MTRVTAAAASLALAFRLAVAWAPMEWLVRRVLQDDPFYYFAIARHLAAGQGFTFDGVEPTNGFHPLWLFVITPIFRLVRDPALAVHVTLTLAACFDVVALVLFDRLLRAAGVRGSVAAAFVVLYALSPIVLSGAGPLNGLETGLNLALTFAFLNGYLKAFVAPPAGAAAALRLGACSGLLLLARTDNAVLLVCCHAALLWRARAQPGRRAAAGAAAVVAGAVVMPWLVWSWIRFGSPVQVSGFAAAHVTRAMSNPQGWTVAALASKLVHNFATVGAYLPIYHLNRSSFIGAVAGNATLVLAIAIAAVLCWHSDTTEERSRLRGALAPWVALIAACVAFIVIHTLRAVELRAWYYTGVVPVGLVVLAIVTSHVGGRLAAAAGAAHRWLAVAAAACVAALLAASLRAGAERRCGEIDAYAMIDEVNRRVPDGTRLGSWNAGLFGYFYARGEVVNLDGLVNNAAYDAILGRSLGAYAARRRIDSLLDAGGAIELAAPYWDGGRPITFPAAVLDNGADRECHHIVLLPLSR